MNYAGVFGHTNQAVAISTLFAIRREVWGFPDGRRHPSDWPTPDAVH